jgi:hypothetical protein
MATGTWGGEIGDSRVFRVKITYTRGGQKCQNGFHIRDLGVATLTPEDVATEAEDFARTQFLKLLGPGDLVTGVDAVNMVTAEGHAIAISGVGGVQTGELLPSGCMVPVTMVGGLRRRYANGRMLWPVSTEGVSSGNELYPPAVATYDTVIADMASRWMDDGVTATQRLVHLHAAKPIRPGGTGSLPAVPASWYDITAIKLNRTISWLTSRKPGHGV